MKRIIVISSGDNLFGPMICGWLRYYCSNDAEVIMASDAILDVDLIGAKVMSDAIIEIIDNRPILIDDIKDQDFDFLLCVNNMCESDSYRNFSFKEIIKVTFEISNVGDADDQVILNEYNKLRDRVEDFCFDFVNKNIKQLIPDDLLSFGNSI